METDHTVTAQTNPSMEGESSRLSKKQRQQARREEKQNLEDAKQRSRKTKRIVKGVLWTLFAAVVVYGLVWSVRAGIKPVLGTAIPEQGREHIAIGAPHAAYNSNPPTSGPHYGQEADWGVYQAELPDEQVLHNLEHGGIWISYNNVDAETIAKIETLAQQYPNKLIVGPRSKNDAKIVLASWTRLLQLDQFDEATIVNFIKANKNRSPEPNAQ